jgi:hypothetical protein
MTGAAAKMCEHCHQKPVPAHQRGQRGRPRTKYCSAECERAAYQQKQSEFKQAERDRRGVGRERCDKCGHLLPEKKE